MKELILFFLRLFGLTNKNSATQEEETGGDEVVVEDDRPSTQEEVVEDVAEEGAYGAEWVIGDFDSDTSDGLIQEDPEPSSREEKVIVDFIPKNKILQILNVFETGSPEGDYGKISTFYDGPNRIRQITYGRSQTTEFGNLKELIQMYISNGGKYAKLFLPYIDRIGKTPSLVTNSTFLNLLKNASKDPIMRSSQDDFFDIRYWNPAFEFFKENGFTYPLSMLVIYDSYIHSGGILRFLRQRFKEVPPAKGGDEKTWISQYVNTRHNWLATHSTIPILRKTIYRTNCFREQISKDNWDLSKPVNANGILIL